jgi:alkylation response protein AidB-like acyl-CoA dehydrogenase
VDFAFDDDQALLRDSTRRFLEKQHPLAALRPVLEAPEVLDRAVWRAGAELGWTAMLVPEAHGGGSVTGQPLVDLVVLAEELGRVLFPGPFVATNVVADAVARSASPNQAEAVLPGIASGATIAAWCLSGDGRPDPGSVEVRGRLEGEQLHLDGVARFVDGATVADLLLVSAVSDAGPLLALVPAATAGVSVRRMDGLDLTRRLGEVTFGGVVVPADAVLGGAPAVIAERALAVATVLQASELVGAADHLLEVTVQYAKDRVQFGRPIGSFQAIKHRLADLHIDLQAMRAAAHYAALALGDGFADAAEAVAVAGSFVADTHAALCGESLQLHGGIGFTWEHDLHLFIRRAKLDQVLYGDGAWHRERLCQLVEAATAAEAG